ncbi:MAG: universal stress protein [Actinobacteria bacterium]|nr:universal stress protein [Actinomycetota bacterium]
MDGRRVLVWVEPGKWQACIRAAADLVPPSGAAVHLLYVPDDSEDLLREAQAGLWGRGRPVRRQPATAGGTELAGTELLADAEALLRDLAPVVSVTTEQGSGPVERVVTAASESADYLVLGRSGDLSRRGPTSLGKHTRFVVDHAQCRVLVVWPETAPSAATIPPLPPGDPRR